MLPGNEPNTFEAPARGGAPSLLLTRCAAASHRAVQNLNMATKLLMETAEPGKTSQVRLNGSDALVRWVFTRTPLKCRAKTFSTLTRNVLHATQWRHLPMEIVLLKCLAIWLLFCKTSCDGKAAAGVPRTAGRTGLDLESSEHVKGSTFPTLTSPKSSGRSRNSST